MASSFSESEVVPAAAALFREWTGLEPDISQEGRNGSGRIDANVILGDVVLDLDVHARGNVATVAGAVEHLARHTSGVGTPVLVVPFMSPQARQWCADADIAWMDLSGNARLQVSTGNTHLAVWIEGRPNAFASKGRAPNVFAPKAARATRTLLLADEPLRQVDIAERSGLGPGYTSKVVRRLEAIGLVTRTPDDAVEPVSRAVLLDAWSQENAYRHTAVDGHFPGRSGEERARRLSAALVDVGVDHAFTGLAAAWAYTHAASFRSVTCYVDGQTGIDAAIEAGLRRDTEAPNTRILIPDDVGVFDGARVADSLRCVSPVQVVVDLLHEPERAEEFSDALRPLAL